jgi:hypothetical protein
MRDSAAVIFLDRHDGDCHNFSLKVRGRLYVIGARPYGIGVRLYLIGSRPYVIGAVHT